MPLKHPCLELDTDPGGRRVELERKLQADMTMSDERKQRQIQQLGLKESTFLRLRRTRLGLEDFRTVKVIGKGAFGEVRPHLNVHFSRVDDFDGFQLTGASRTKS